MATDVISNLSGSLDAELEKARETLKNVDDDIKKVFGKDAAELTVFGRSNRRGGMDAVPPQDDQHFNEHFGQRVRRRDERDGDEPNEKRRREGFTTAMGRLGPMAGGGGGLPRFGGGRLSRDSFDNGDPSRRLASRVVSFGKDKSRDEVMAAQRQDRSGRERNRRMFGALLGTLQRFKQDETKLKEKEDKRAQIEAKLDEAAQQEREVVKTKKHELIKERKLRLTEIKRIEVKRTRLAEMEQWEEKTKYLTNFIRTEAKPHIFYLPKIMNPIMECRLEQSKQYVTEMISHKRKIVLEDLEDYEQRSKRYWEGRMAGRTSNKKIDPMDADIEDELHEIMKHDELPDEAEDFKVTVFTTEEQASSIKFETNGLSSRIDLAEEGKENVKLEPEREEDDAIDQETTIEIKVEEEKVEETITTNNHQQEEEEEEEEVVEEEEEEVVEADDNNVVDQDCVAEQEDNA